MQMLRTIRSTASALAIIVAGTVAAGPTVNLDDGTAIEGLIQPTYQQVEQFLGIPYASAPVNDLRWAKAQPPAKVKYINATIPAPSCMQSVPTDDPVFTAMFPAEYEPPKEPMGEDCLRLSLWRPKLPATNTTALLPVLIFIHGGAFMGGSETVPYQIPTQWVQRTQNLIVVSLNYRLGVFGFPNAAGLTDQNLGILDQRLAITWVRDNIKSFGGDPSRIVLWGQSAGAASVDYQMFAYPTDPIARGAIMDSGSASMMGGGSDTTHAAFNRMATAAGCRNSSTQLTCLRGKSAADVLTAAGGGGLGSGFGPVVDNVVVFANYAARAKQGSVADVPSIIGMNAQDIGGSQCPGVLAARNRVTNGRKAYRYLYSGNFDNVGPKPNPGAFHTAELPLLFGTHPNYRGNSTPFEYQVSTVMQDSWYAFINDTANGLERVGWMPWNISTPNVRNFGASDTPAKTIQDAGCAPLVAQHLKRAATNKFSEDEDSKSASPKGIPYRGHYCD